MISEARLRELLEVVRGNVAAWSQAEALARHSGVDAGLAALAQRELIRQQEYRDLLDGLLSGDLELEDWRPVVYQLVASHNLTLGSLGSWVDQWFFDQPSPPET